MPTNLDRFRNDLDKLLKLGNELEAAMQYEISPDEFKAQARKHLGKGAAEFLKNLPSFKKKYQHWYSESLGRR